MASDLICQSCVHDRHGIWCESGDCECCGVLATQFEEQREVGFMQSRSRGEG